MSPRPHKNDVLFGRGAAINSHHGNKYFRKVVEREKPKFAMTPRAEKREIATRIIDEIKSSGGSFLMEDPKSASHGETSADNGMSTHASVQVQDIADRIKDPFILDKVWVHVDGDKVIDKVMHRLRESKENISKKQKLTVQEILEQPPVSSKKSSGNDLGTLRGITSSEMGMKSEPSKHCSQHGNQEGAKDVLNKIQIPYKTEEVGRAGSSADSLARGLNQMPNNNIQEIYKAMGVSQTRPGLDRFWAPRELPNNIQEFYKAAKMSQSISSGFSWAPKKLPNNIEQLYKANEVSRAKSSMDGIARASKERSDNFQQLCRAEEVSPKRSSAVTFVQAPSPVPPVKFTSIIENPVLAPPAPSTPLSIQSWIRTTACISLSPNDFLLSAVNFSWLLTKQLMQMFAASEINSLADIAMDRAVVFVVPPSKAHTSSTLPIKAIQFQPCVRSLMSKMSQLDKSERSSRSICAALGNILLEVFSKGRSSAPNSSSYANPNAFNFTHQPATSAFGFTQYEHPTTTMPPSKRNKISSSMGGHITTIVNGLLLEVGMPLSIRHLVCDLVNAVNEPRSTSTVTSLEEVLWDLTQMKEQPQRFLFERMSPQQALEGLPTCVFTNGNSPLYGREMEVEGLMAAKKNIVMHVNLVDSPSLADTNSEEKPSLCKERENNFICESVFLSGYAGAGKSSLLQPLINDCNRDWFVLSCKFDTLAAPIKVLAKALDNFFSKWGPSKNGAGSDLDPAMKKAFEQVCQSILSTIDNEGLSQLCELIPSLSCIFLESPSAEGSRSRAQGTTGTSSIDKVGSATKRRMCLFNVLFASICSAGYPVLVVLDDIQWSDHNVVESIEDFVINYVHNSSNIWRETLRRGMLLVGTFRSNEVHERDDIIKMMDSFEQSESVKLTTLAIAELKQNDITKLLSEILCLPMRYTLELAGLVLSKTMGNPFFIIQFLRSIIQANLLHFSSHRWCWDIAEIDMHMISDGVAQLLTTRFNQLPIPLIQTARIVSCFGSQVDDSTIDILNDGQRLLPFNMQDALLKLSFEGIMEKAGPIHQFTHDIVQQSIYDSITIANKKLLHKTIGTLLLRSADNVATIYLLAVDQLNIYTKDAILSSEERAHIASINTTAARFAIAEFSFERARSYIDTGMRLLDANRWNEEYALTLKLYEMCATLSCMNGDIESMHCTLTEVLANVKSFDDSLTPSALLVKALVASSKYDDAISKCLSVLSTLGEEFPEDISMSLVLSELSVIQATLANITVQQVKLLPPMMDKTKLHAMKFLSMLSNYCIRRKPMLVPILSSRMVRLTIEEGFCDDSIVGLVVAGYGLFSFTDEIVLGYRIGKVGESLIEQSSNMHALRCRLCFELDCTLKALVEPMQFAVANCSDRYDSALLTGDLDSAMHSLFSHCIGSLHIGMKLTLVAKSFVACIKQSTKYQQKFVQYPAMSSFGTCIFLSGRNDHGLCIKSYEELNEIGRRTNQVILVYHTNFNLMYQNFWMRDFMKVAELGEKHKRTGQKRTLEFIRIFFEGIACLSLARQTHKPNWRKTGEDALKKMLKWEEISWRNFEYMAKLLQAEVHYLNGDLTSADDSYKASIEAAREHKFIHYEALGYELYGIFCIETKNVEKGMEKLQISVARYIEWGADRKVEDLRSFMELVKVANPC